MIHGLLISTPMVAARWKCCIASIEISFTQLQYSNQSADSLSLFGCSIRFLGRSLKSSWSLGTSKSLRFSELSKCTKAYKTKNQGFSKAFLINQFHTTSFFLYILKISENIWFSDILRGYGKRPVTWSRLKGKTFVQNYLPTTLKSIFAEDNNYEFKVAMSWPYRTRKQKSRCWMFLQLFFLFLVNL